MLFPSCCLFCHEVAEKVGCCASCLRSIKTCTQSICRSCGVELSRDLLPGPCGKCLHSPPFQAETTSMFSYDGAVRDAILAWKLGSDDAAVHWLINSSAQRLKTVFNSSDLLLPVPMPLSRMRKSGQHHGADMVRMIAAVVGCSWDWRLLRRRGERQRQSALSGSERRKNLGRSFHLDRDYMQESGGLSSFTNDSTRARIWIVDDILTTGATLHHASKALRSLRQPIYAFSLARTPHK